MKKIILALAAGLLFGAGLHAYDGEEIQWKASWITKQQSNGGTNSWIAFKKSVTLETVPQTLTARIAADTKYWMWINDSLVVFEGGLKRGPAPGDSYFDEVEIAPYLQKGSNAIAILVWHLGRSGFSHMDSGSIGLLFQAIGDNGLEILSDKSWQAAEYFAFSTAAGPVPNHRLPESNIRFDGRMEKIGWTSNDPHKRLGTAMVMACKPGEAPFGKLVRRPVPLWKDYGMKDYSGTSYSGDTLICKVPYNCHMTPYMKIEASSGGLVVGMETDHRLITGAECIRAEYVTRKGIQEYENLGWMNGEEMRYIIPEGVKVLEVKYRETGYDADFTGSFHCDDELLNEYWLKAARTLYVCMRDTYYDCPDRERAQWWGDEVNELGEAFFILSRSSDMLALKGIRELVNWQREDGSMYAPVPTSNYFTELPIQILASVGWYGFHNYWFYSGDDSFIADVYEGMHKYLHSTWKVDASGLPIYREGDWDWPDAGDNCDKYALVGPWYYLALKGELAFAERLGKKDDCSLIRGMMKAIEENYNARFWQGTEYRSQGYDGETDDRVHAMAVVSGLADKSMYPAIRKVLSEQYHATTYMQRYVLEALFMMGEPEMALERMHKLYPTVMKDGCSTLWEHWDYDGTCNHAWTGGGIIELGRKVAGVEPLEPGFKSFRVAPQMGYLKEVDCRIDTNSGLIEVSLRKKGRRTNLTLSVPAGTTAKVCDARGKELSLGEGKHEVVL